MKRSAAERMAINMPVQGTAADLMKEAMIRIHEALPAEGLLTKLLLQVHDELVFEAPVSELDALRELAQRMMVGVSKSTPGWSSRSKSRSRSARTGATWRRTDFLGGSGLISAQRCGDALYAG